MNTLKKTLHSQGVKLQVVERALAHKCDDSLKIKINKI